ncbi:carbohydrate kinase [Microvirga sp. KLBC 81]|uniref:carbohydrate kinase family protein n=1 Tax=Microvirga sp. KLBC 81 TaxID=1862707 RepID=UPI000D51E740|nr:carbohydrate kinase [Microvirga sp. KLBC 81]PVE20492.1 carbohydrate kinase [Microvirga sp. KLBC 81]
MILVCGEALIDLFVNDGPLGGLKTEVALGGSPFNVAIALSRLGERSSFYGGISTDHFGYALRETLASEGVDLAYAVRSGRLTTISVVATDETGHPAYSFHGEGKADRQVTEADLPPMLPDTIEAITFGSYTMAVAPVANTYLALARRESERLTISIDPNVRPTVTPDMKEWRDRFETFLPYASIVKASDEDLVTAYGPDVDVEGLVRHWHTAGPSLILVTHGATGATGYLRGHTPVAVPGRKVVVVDTVGAGDTFHAAALAYLAKIGRLARCRFQDLTIAELQQTLRYAVAASSITCTRQGANVPTDAEVQSALVEEAPESDAAAAKRFMKALSAALLHRSISVRT